MFKKMYELKDSYRILTPEQAGMKASWVITDEERRERSRRMTGTSSAITNSVPSSTSCTYSPLSDDSEEGGIFCRKDGRISDLLSRNRYNHEVFVKKKMKQNIHSKEHERVTGRPPQQQHLPPLLTETELQFIDNLVNESGLFESRMIADLNVHLARQLVR